MPCCWTWRSSSSPSETLVEHGFTPIITPDLARNQILEGIGFTPRGRRDAGLLGRGHRPQPGRDRRDHAGRDARRRDPRRGGLPLKYVGLSHCFRTEAGAAGRASRGLYRVHQFTKVEMFAFTDPGDLRARCTRSCWRSRRRSSSRWASLTACSTSARATWAARPIASSTSRPGCPAAARHGEYGEVTSTSDCTDYQARRLNIRYRPAGQKGTRFVHTLNGTAVALSRALIVVLENYQRADGLIDVPEVLKPYLGKDVIGVIAESERPRHGSESTVRRRYASSVDERRILHRSRQAISMTIGGMAGAKSAPGARPPRADPGGEVAALRDFFEDQHPGRIAELIEDLEAEDGDALFRHPPAAATAPRS